MSQCNIYRWRLRGRGLNRLHRPSWLNRRRRSCCWVGLAWRGGRRSGEVRWRRLMARPFRGCRRIWRRGSWFREVGWFVRKGSSWRGVQRTRWYLVQRIQRLLLSRRWYWNGFRYRRRWCSWRSRSIYGGSRRVRVCIPWRGPRGWRIRYRRRLRSFEVGFRCRSI